MKSHICSHTRTLMPLWSAGY